MTAQNRHPNLVLEAVGQFLPIHKRKAAHNLPGAYAVTKLEAIT